MYRDRNWACSVSRSVCRALLRLFSSVSRTSVLTANRFLIPKLETLIAHDDAVMYYYIRFVDPAVFRGVITPINISSACHLSREKRWQCQEIYNSYYERSCGHKSQDCLEVGSTSHRIKIWFLRGNGAACVWLKKKSRTNRALNK